MLRSARTAVVATSSLAVFLALPAAAHAGTRAHTSCATSSARWHFPGTPQPEGGYVTVDFGNNGVDYTTTLWESDAMFDFGQRFSGTSIRIRWYDGQHNLLKTSGNGIIVTTEACEPPPTTTLPPPTTDAPATTVIPPDSTATPSTTQATTTVAPVPTDPTGSTTLPGGTTVAVATTVQLVESTVGRTTPVAQGDSTSVVAQRGPSVPTSGLPITGTKENRTAIGGAVALITGLVMLRLARRRPATV